MLDVDTSLKVIRSHSLKTEQNMSTSLIFIGNGPHGSLQQENVMY